MPKKSASTQKARTRRKPPIPKPIQAATSPAPQPLPDLDLTGADGLTDRQRVFVSEYLRCWNATEAARIAGYKDPVSSGYENRLKPEVKALIDARLKAHHLGADEVLARLSDHAMGSMGDFIDYEIDSTSGRRLSYISLDKARQAGKLHLIKKITINDKGIGVELYDADAALGLLGKHYELFTEKHKHEGELTAHVPEFDALLDLIYGKLRRPGDPTDDGLPAPSVPR